MLNFLSITPGHITALPSPKGAPGRVHEFDERSIAAVNLALAAKRPLLVRGEPGVGKTQLAEAVAAELQRAYYPFTVDARTESRDLLWRFDAVMRLAQAQLCGALHQTPEAIETALDVTRFIHPGPLWWAFNTKSAGRASPSGSTTPLKPYDNEARQANGWVVLIDEIDKAESDVPNGLLEALGAVQFTPFGYEEPVRVGDVPPLIIITTNEERALPDAFVRRCLVLHLELPSHEDALINYLMQRGRAHFNRRTTTDEVLREAARQLVGDRRVAAEQQLSPLPGQAEYLDLIRGVVELAPRKFKDQLRLIQSAARFTYKKHPSLSQRIDERPS